jgi:hypothetical protein
MKTPNSVSSEPGTGQIDFSGVAEGHPAMLRADLVLGDERAVFVTATGSNAEPKARHDFIEFDVFGLAGRHLEASDIRLSEFHVTPEFAEAGSGRTWEDFDRLPMSSQVAVWQYDPGVVAKNRLNTGFCRDLSSHVNNYSRTSNPGVRGSNPFEAAISRTQAEPPIPSIIVAMGPTGLPIPPDFPLGWPP